MYASEAFVDKYTEEGLIKLVVSLDDGPGATKFKDEVVTHWLSNPDHPLNMLKRLKLDDARDDLLASPLLDIWTKYMKAFNKEYPFAETTMIQTLTKSYGDEKLAAIILKVPGTEKKAKDLQTTQFNHWMAGEKTSDDIYKKVLKLDSTDSPNADVLQHVRHEGGKLFSFKP